MQSSRLPALWLNWAATMGTGGSPAGLVHHPHSAGRELAPVLGLFVILIWNSSFPYFCDFFFLNLRQVFPHIPTKRCACTREYICTYNIDVLPLLLLPGHFLRLKSLHMQFSTDTRPHFRWLLPSLLSENSQHNSMYPVYICMCSDMYIRVLPAASAPGKNHSRGAQEIFAQRPTRWLPKASCHFPRLHALPSATGMPDGRVVYEIMRTNSPCNVAQLQLT